MNILLAVDGSTYTRKMLAYLSAHDEMLGPGHAYTALTVQTPLPPRVRATLDKATVQQYYEEEEQKVLAPVVKYLSKKGVQLKTLAKTGMAGDVIAKTAEDGKFDLIVMGAHGHGALGKLVMGSVSTRVLARCSVPVLLVR